MKLSQLQAYTRPQSAYMQVKSSGLLHGVDMSSGLMSFYRTLDISNIE